MLDEAVLPTHILPDGPEHHDNESIVTEAADLHLLLS
jgi:hypothetical protein